VADKKRRYRHTSHKEITCCRGGNTAAGSVTRSKKRHSSFFEDRSFGDTCRVVAAAMASSPVGLKLVSLLLLVDTSSRGNPGEETGLWRRKLDSTVIMVRRVSPINLIALRSPS